MADEPGTGPEPIEGDGAVGDVGAEPAGEVKFDESTIPSDVRQRFIDQGVDIGYGKARSKAEKEFEPYVEVWNRIEKGELTEQEWETLKGLPGISRYLSPPKDGGSEPNPEVSALQDRLEKLESGISSQRFQSAVSSLQEKIQERAGTNKLKAEYMSRGVSQLLMGAGGDERRAQMVQQMASMGDDKWKALEEWADAQTKPIIESIQSEYLNKKKKSAEAGAEGSQGVPDGPEPPESVGAFGDFDDLEFKKAVLSQF